MRIERWSVTSRNGEAGWCGRRKHQVVSHRGSIYLLGGYTSAGVIGAGSGQGANLNDVWKSVDGAVRLSLCNPSPLVSQVCDRLFAGQFELLFAAYHVSVLLRCVPVYSSLKNRVRRTKEEHVQTYVQLYRYTAEPSRTVPSRGVPHVMVLSYATD